VERLDGIIKSYFKTIEFRDRIPESEWEFGYFGRHYVQVLPSDVKGDFIDKSTLPDFFELQVKTLFQHAWSEAEHDLGYKPGSMPLSPDEKRLYVSDSAQGLWMVYGVKPDGTLGGGRVFFDAKPWTKTRKGAPDGLKVDRQGNLFASGPEVVYIFAAAGTHLGTIETGVPTANCAWGDDGSTLYITANTAVYRIRLTTRGAGF